MEEMFAILQYRHIGVRFLGKIFDIIELAKVVIGTVQDYRGLIPFYRMA